MTSQNIITDAGMDMTAENDFSFDKAVDKDSFPVVTPDFVKEFEKWSFENKNHSIKDFIQSTKLLSDSKTLTVEDFTTDKAVDRDEYGLLFANFAKEFEKWSFENKNLSIGAFIKATGAVNDVVVYPNDIKVNTQIGYTLPENLDKEYRVWSAENKSLDIKDFLITKHPEIIEEQNKLYEIVENSDLIIPESNITAIDYKAGLQPTEQHAKITGYRKLSDNEINLMNKIKGIGNEVGDLFEKMDYQNKIDIIKEINEKTLSAVNILITYLKPEMNEKEPDVIIDSDALAYVTNFATILLKQTVDYISSSRDCSHEHFTNTGKLETIFAYKTVFMWLIRSIAKPQTFA